MQHQLTTLPNGLKIILVKTPEFKSLCGYLLLKAGPEIESIENNGISHFLEHMILEGSDSFPDKDLFDEKIELLGGSYNAYTSSSKIGVKITLPDDQQDLVIKYLHSVATEATLPEKSFKSEKNAILDEIHNHESGQYWKFNKYWKGHRYNKAKTPLDILGNRSGIRKLKQESVLEWYQKIMHPANMTLCIVGNIDFDSAMGSISQLFGPLANPTHTISELDYEKIEHSQATFKTQVDTKSKQAVGTISFPGFSLYGNDYKERQAARILENVFANYRSSILFKKLRKDMGLLYDIYVDQSFGTTSPGLFEIVFTTSDDKVALIYKLILEEISKLRANGLDKNLLNLGIESGNNSLKMGHSSLGDIVNWFAPSVFWFNRIHTVDEAIQVRSEIDLNYANEILERVFDPARINIISRVGSEKSKRALESEIRI